MADDRAGEALLVLLLPPVLIDWAARGRGGERRGGTGHAGDFRPAADK